MSDSQPALLYPDAIGSGPIVYDAYDKWSSIALQAFATAQQLASQLANIPLSPVAFNASFDPQLALSAFPVMPAPLVPPGLGFNEPSLPSPPTVFTIPMLPPAPYVSDLLATMEGVINALLAGGNLIPAAVADQLRNRAYTEAFTEEQRAVDQAYDEFAARGFSEPSGQLNQRVTEARSDARQKRQMVNRDVFIQEQTVAIENLRFAVTSGIQLEGTKVQVYVSQVQVDVEYAKLEVEQQRIALDGWRALVERFDAQLKGEIARVDSAVEVFKAQVQIYTAQAQVATMAGEYDNRRFQLNLTQEQAIVDTEMKRQDQQFEQMKYLTTIMMEIKKALAQVSAQLASAAMSAVNVGASLSSSTSESVGYSLSVGFSGSMDSSDS
jgi:hypothetical protein